MINVPFWRVGIYVFIAYFSGFYLGTLAVSPEIACVEVDKRIYCGRLVGGDN